MLRVLSVVSLAAVPAAADVPARYARLAVSLELTATPIAVLASAVYHTCRGHGILQEADQPDLQS